MMAGGDARPDLEIGQTASALALQLNSNINHLKKLHVRVS
jgi:hypothetical protein